MVKTKGSVSHPSLTRAYTLASAQVPDLATRITHWLHIKVTITQNCFLCGIIADLSKKCRRKVQLLSFELLSAERDRSDLCAYGLQLFLEELSHPKDIFAVLDVAAHTEDINGNQSIIWALCCGCMYYLGIATASANRWMNLLLFSSTKSRNCFGAGISSSQRERDTTKYEEKREELRSARRVGHLYAQPAGSPHAGPRTLTLTLLTLDLLHFTQLQASSLVFSIFIFH